MWVDVLGRHQPDDGATYAEPVAQSLFSRPRERLAIEGAPPARHGGWGAHATRCSSRYNSRDLRVATVYTNAPKWHREAILVNLCTLLTSPRLSATAPQPNSVHKCPNPARRGPILPFVYTIAIPRPPTTQAHSATVYTNAPIRRGEAVLANLCTLLRSHNCTRDRAGPLVPRRRRPHGPRDARALGPEAHAARVVTYPSIRVHDASYIMQFFAQFNVKKHNSV